VSFLGDEGSSVGDRFVSVDEVEAVIGLLRDVVSAKVVANHDGAIEEVHVLVSSGRAPKQIVRDIESAVMAKLGLEIDHKKISVAQIGDTGRRGFRGEAAVAAGQFARLRFVDVNISIDGPMAQARVRLARDAEVFEGCAGGANTEHNHLRMIAAATLDAVCKSCPADGVYVLEDIDRSVVLAGERVVVAYVNRVTSRTEEHLTGSALVRSDLWKAVVSASLDAVNRRAGLTMEEAGERVKKPE
jgi:hypothetical protein